MINKNNSVCLLVLGIVILTATHLSFSVDLFAWVSSVPFLIYLSKKKGFKSKLLFVLALIVAWSFITAKIITPPIPFAMVFLFSIPISLFHLPGYLLWDRFKEHKWSFLLFPSVMVVMEWIQYTFTPFASWGVAAYTQSQTSSLMQAVSLFGMAGLSFLIYWINISITELVLKQKSTWLTFQIPLAVLLLLVIVGTLRFDISKSVGAETITVAAVGTDSKVAGLPLPSKESNDCVKSVLFERTKTAAKCNAKLVVWNEAAIFCLHKDEPSWKDSLSSLAKKLKIFLVASYVMPVSESPFIYENKYLIIDANGSISYTYHKHQPVPGEPAIKGEEPLKVIDIEETKIGGAICYDYDFPYLAREFGKLNADIVAVPSSDWRGIDPLHTRMAAFRAIEQGHSILRSTRFGLSAAITPWGEMISQMSSFDKNDKIMIAHLPAKGVVTLYSLIGDSFVYLCLVIIVVVIWAISKPNSFSS
jgi:apolipoprotein N-acyltransferase